VPGRGHSSPIVWKDRIFLTTVRGDGRVSMLAFSRADGKLLWETVNPDTTPESLHQKNSASATPSTDSTRVCIVRQQGSAVDFEGRIVWHRSLGTFNNYHGRPARRCSTESADRLQIAPAGHLSLPSTATGKTVWQTAGAARSDGARRSQSAPSTTTRSS
jgi:hypothetical protein